MRRPSGNCVKKLDSNCLCVRHRIPFKGDHSRVTLYEQYCLESHHIDRKGKRSTQAKDLPRTVEFAIGMKVMVTENIEIDLDLTNGARGEIVDIVLHPDEPPIGDEPVVHLKYMPTYRLSRR